MIIKVLTATVIILLVAAGWLAVQAAARRFAAHHPEYGPAREDGAGGCGHCHSCGETCDREE